MVNESHNICFYQQLQHTSEDVPVHLQKNKQHWACLPTSMNHQPALRRTRKMIKLPGEHYLCSQVEACVTKKNYGDLSD